MPVCQVCSGNAGIEAGRAFPGGCEHWGSRVPRPVVAEWLGTGTGGPEEEAPPGGGGGQRAHLHSGSGGPSPPRPWTRNASRRPFPSTRSAGPGAARGRLGPPSDGVHKLVDEALGDVWLPDDALLVILADGAAQLVIVHGRAVLPDAPQPGHLGGVLNFEDAWGAGGPETASGASGEQPSRREKDQELRSVSQKAMVSGPQYLLPVCWGLKKCVQGACTGLSMW